MRSVTNTEVAGELDNATCEESLAAVSPPSRGPDR